MNNDVINEIEERLNVSNECALKIQYIIEENYTIGKKKKEIIVDKLIEELNVDDERANEIYDTVMDIVSKRIKEKLKHPFRNMDK